MKKVDLNLLAIINQVISDLDDPSAHYLVIANYYFYHDKLTNFAPVYFNYEAIDEVQLTEDGLKCKLVFHVEDPGNRFNIRIPYNQIGKISKFNNPDLVQENILFLNEEVMHRYNHSGRSFSAS